MTEFELPHNPSRPESNSLTSAELTRRQLLRMGLLGGFASYVAGCDTGETRPEPKELTDVERTAERFADTPSIEFDFAKMPDGPLDPNTWNIKLGPENYDGAGQQIYTDKPDNLAIRNGNMVVTAHKQTMSGKPFTAGRVDTLNKVHFGFGRLVIPVRMPAGRGIHPAVWMRRAPKPGEDDNIYGEIDIAEYVGHRPDRIFTNLHTNATRKRPDKKGIVTAESQEGIIVPEVSDRMVEYVVDRTAEGIQFFVDGKKAGRLYEPVEGGKDAWPFAEDDEYYLIANIAVGDRWAGGLEGVDTETAPWQMLLESVRFYPETK